MSTWYHYHHNTTIIHQWLPTPTHMWDTTLLVTFQWPRLKTTDYIQPNIAENYRYLLKNNASTREQLAPHRQLQPVPPEHSPQQQRHQPRPPQQALLPSDYIYHLLLTYTCSIVQAAMDYYIAPVSSTMGGTTAILPMKDKLHVLAINICPHTLIKSGLMAFYEHDSANYIEMATTVIEHFRWLHSPPAHYLRRDVTTPLSLRCWL